MWGWGVGGGAGLIKKDVQALRMMMNKMNIHQPAIKPVPTLKIIGSIPANPSETARITSNK